MTNTMTRILTGVAMAVVVIATAVAERYGIHAVRWLMLAVAAGMTGEFLWASRRNMRVLFFALYMLLFVFSAFVVGADPLIVLLLLLIIVAADTGAWFFGLLIRGDKMWERLSPNKSWAGQIAGVLCGGLIAVAFTQLKFMFLIGVAVALLSQYGDLAASAIKRKLGIKDYSRLLPGHGGLMDRFDGWLFVLPIVWLILI